MIQHHRKPLAELTSQALTLLVQHIGTTDTIRFLSQYTSGGGNYTEERTLLFQDMTLDSLVSTIQEQQQHSEQ
jgi:hypothetical protein